MSDSDGLKVVGAGVGRTGTLSLKLALERLLGGPCHHMIEVYQHPDQMSWWTDAIEGRPVDWRARLAGYAALVDWPGCSFWRELCQTYPDALVVLSVRDPGEWYLSASRTIFTTFVEVPPDAASWIETLRLLFRERFSDHFTDEETMIAAYDRHNAAVREEIPPSRLLEWKPGDGWAPICDRLGVPVPDEPYPHTNTTNEFRQRLGLAPF